VPAPTGFTYRRRGDREVVIHHHGRVATILRHARAAAFLADIEDAPPGADQELMARVTGNYRRGNERLAGQHPRHRTR